MRAKRAESVINLYHIVTRGTGYQLIFEDDDDRHLLHALLHKAFVEYGVILFAWCFMGNHIHLLVQGNLESLSAALKQTLGTYAMAFNRKHDRCGHLFQERFKSEPINDEAHLLTAVRYIHQNPMKAGLTDTCQWPWSSFGEYTGASSLPPLCSRRFILDLFGGLNWFLSFHEVSDSNDTHIDAIGRNQRSKTRAMTDSEALRIAERLLGETAVEQMKSWPRDRRNNGILELKGAGLTNSQITRLTGISRGAIEHLSVDAR